MQRIIFINMHLNWMINRVALSYIFRFSSALKHRYLINYLLNNKNYEVCNYINDRGFSIIRSENDSIMKLLNIFSKCENMLTMKVNKNDTSQIRIIKNINEIRDDDIVIIYNCCRDQFRELEKIHAFKALSMLHFHGRSSEDADIRNADISCYFNEVNLSKSSEIFQHYYHVEKPWIVHPFVFAERFQNKKPFRERKNKCFSTGTITYKAHPEFIDVYGDPCDQPARKFVKDNPEFFAGTVDCYSWDYLEDEPGKTVNPTDNPLIKLYKKVYNRLHVGKQKKYFSFDMVEKFNEYKMHLVGEEILGVPGIGYVEGMACGSAYIGLDSPMYRDLGLIPGVHYIAYDGTKEGLRSTVEFWQKEENQEKLEEIARTGCHYIRENFCGQKVAENLLARLAEEHRAWCAGKADRA